MICRAYDFVAELNNSCCSCCYETIVVPIHEKTKKIMELIKSSICSFVELSKNILINRVTITILQEANKISNIAFSALNPTTGLSRAVLHNNLDLAKACLEKPISDDHLRLSFNTAVLKGHLEIVRIILAKSTNIGIWYRGLYDAVEKGHLDIVKEILLNQSLNLNELEDDQFSLAVKTAYENNHIEIIKEILKCSRISEKTIQRIFNFSCFENLPLLLSELFSARFISNEIINNGMLLAIAKGHQPVVEEIILLNREPVLQNAIEIALVHGKNASFVQSILRKISDVNSDVIGNMSRFLDYMVRFFQKNSFGDKAGVREFRVFLSGKVNARHSRDINQAAYLRFIALNLE